MPELPDEAEPDGDVMAPHHFYLGVILATYGFLFIWPTYPLTGSTAALIGLLIALDDVVDHMFPVTTPLDYVYNRWVRRYIP